MGFGHRDEQSFDGVMRLAFCVDGTYEDQVGVEVRQRRSMLELTVHDRPGHTRRPRRGDPPGGSSGLGRP